MTPNNMNKSALQKQNDITVQSDLTSLKIPSNINKTNSFNTTAAPQDSKKLISEKSQGLKHKQTGFERNTRPDKSNHLLYDDHIKEKISVTTSDNGHLYHNRSASYIAIQSHLREVQPSQEIETQSYYDRLFMQSQNIENISSQTKVEDGTPKNTISEQMQAIRQTLKQSQKNQSIAGW